jgi:hypothetical protein
MPQHNVLSRNVGPWPLMSVARGVALAVLVICATAATARAGDYEDPNATQASNKSIYDKMLDVIGLSGRGAIQYSERSPLVVPPTRDLPPPSANAAPPVPNWPKDPDVARAKQAKAKEKVGPHPDWVIESSRPMTPQELRAGGSNPAATPTTPGPACGPADCPDKLEPNKKSVLNFDWLKKEQYATFTGEPPRTSLTEPPPGYQTPSADQPYGIGPAHKQYKVPTVADRMEPTSGTAGGN